MMIKTSLTKLHYCVGCETKCIINPKHHCTICYKRYCEDCYYDEIYEDDMCNECFNDMETCSKIEINFTDSV
jgi:hypothetical protein